MVIVKTSTKERQRQQEPTPPVPPGPQQAGSRAVLQPGLQLFPVFSAPAPLALNPGPRPGHGGKPAPTLSGDVPGVQTPLTPCCPRGWISSPLPAQSTISSKPPIFADPSSGSYSSAQFVLHISVPGRGTHPPA